MEKNKMPALLGAVALCLAAPASAALYRCGNVFQDRPCDGPVAREAPQAGASAPAAARRAASTPLPESAHVAPTPAAQAALEPASAPASATAAASAAPRKKGPPSLACPNLRVQRTAIEARLQAGGRPQTVQMYQRQLREVEQNLVEGNCS